MRRSGRVHAWLALLWLLWLPLAQAQDEASGAVAAEPALEVTLITVEPGALYWQRFGHNAILLERPGARNGVSYNFGYFDFGQPDFLMRFLRGRMLYQAVPPEAVARLLGATGPAAQAFAKMYRRAEQRPEVVQRQILSL